MSTQYKVASAVRSASVEGTGPTMWPACPENGPPDGAKQGSAKLRCATMRARSAALHGAASAPASAANSRPPMKRMQGTGSLTTLVLASMSSRSTRWPSGAPSAAAISQVPLESTVGAGAPSPLAR